MSLKRIAMPIWTATLLAMSLATPNAAQAAPAPDAGNDIEAPVFGTSMVISVLIDSAGGFISAEISPAGPPAAVMSPESGDTGGGSQSDQMGAFEIKFDSGDSPVETLIKLDDGTTTGAGPIAVAGDQQWVGDPLGNGDIVVVGYTLGTDSTGTPTIVVNSINGTVPADTGVVASAGEITWYQIIEPTVNNGHLFQFITFFDAPDDPAAQVSTNLTFDVVATGGEGTATVSLTDPNAASTINGTATPRGEHEDDDDDDDEHEDEHEEHEDD